MSLLRRFAKPAMPVLTLASTRACVVVGTSQVPIRTFAAVKATKGGFTKVGKVAGATASHGPSAKQQAKMAVENLPKPKLNEVLRKFWKLTHPDLFSNYPAQRHTNEQSMMVLQGFLSSIKDPSGDAEYPKLRNQHIEFILRTTTPGHFKRAHMLLHLNGHPDRSMVYKSFTDFFKVAGLANDFEWDAEYWPLKGPRSPRPVEEEEFEEYQSTANMNESYEEFNARMKAEAERGSRR